MSRAVAFVRQHIITFSFLKTRDVISVSALERSRCREFFTFNIEPYRYVKINFIKKESLFLLWVFDKITQLDAGCKRPRNSSKRPAND
jgi:hypothetical protein